MIRFRFGYGGRSPRLAVSYFLVQVLTLPLFFSMTKMERINSRAVLMRTGWLLIQAKADIPVIGEE